MSKVCLIKLQIYYTLRKNVILLAKAYMQNANNNALKLHCKVSILCKITFNINRIAPFEVLIPLDKISILDKTETKPICCKKEHL